ncbi:MAG: hypothetical protein ACRC2T_07145 [Thermoguttaceae bacterium]
MFSNAGQAEDNQYQTLKNSGTEAAFIGWLWRFERIFVQSPSGRRRLNVLGAYDVMMDELTRIINDSYITATEVCEKEMPILRVLRNVLGVQERNPLLLESNRQAIQEGSRNADAP